jgi:hypothetical protein
MTGGTTVSASGLNLVNGETEDWYRVYFADDTVNNTINARFKVTNLPSGCSMTLYLWNETSETDATCLQGIWPASQPSCLTATGLTTNRSSSLLWSPTNVGSYEEDTFLLQIACPVYTSGQCNAPYSIEATKTN